MIYINGENTIRDRPEIKIVLINVYKKWKSWVDWRKKDLKYNFGYNQKLNKLHKLYWVFPGEINICKTFIIMNS